MGGDAGSAMTMTPTSGSEGGGEGKGTLATA